MAVKKRTDRKKMKRAKRGIEMESEGQGSYRKKRQM